jgi:nucleotide-binding universal stress UspA family protein
MTGTPLQTILLATDGSPDASLAARAATALCQQTGARLHVVHVWRLPVLATAGTGPNYPDQPDTGHTSDYEAYEQQSEQVLADQLVPLQRAGLHGVVEHLCQGRPAEQIVQLGAAIPADLIVIGSRGLGPVRRLVLGSVSEGVVHEATCPVLVLRGGPDDWPPHRLIIGDDGSPTASRAATLAAQLGQFFHSHAVLVRTAPDLPRAPYQTAAERQQQRDTALQEAEAALALQAQRLTPLLGRAPAVRVALDDPARVLIATAEESDAPALIAVGSHGYGPFRRYRLGSVSTAVLRAASCPVLVVPQQPESTSADGAR